MKRWLLWNFRCLRGRRCADVIPSTIDPSVAAIDGGIINIAYTCGGCGTNYVRRAKIVGPTIVLLPREIIS